MRKTLRIIEIIKEKFAMLAKLTIKNVALIESAEIEFSEGLNVLSGETGAGRQFFFRNMQANLAKVAQM